MLDRQKSDKTKTVRDDASSISAQKKKQPKENREEGRVDRRGERLGETKRDKEWEMNENDRSRSHHQTNTRAGLPFLTDSNGEEEEKNKGSSGNKELIKNSKKVKLPDWSRKREKQNSCTSLQRNNDDTKGFRRKKTISCKNTTGTEGELKGLNHWLCTLFHVGFSFCLSYCT